MRRVEDECVGCEVPGYPCMGARCPNRDVVHYYCDVCGKDIPEGELYGDADEDLCEDCLKDRFVKEWEEEE